MLNKLQDSKHTDETTVKSNAMGCDLTSEKIQACCLSDGYTHDSLMDFDQHKLLSSSSAHRLFDNKFNFSSGEQYRVPENTIQKSIHELEIQMKFTQQFQ